MAKAFTPNTTQTPNVVFDSLMADLPDSELRVLLVIIRKTYGWQKDTDRISNSQFEAMTGLKVTAIKCATRSLSDKGLIVKSPPQKMGGMNEYEFTPPGREADPLLVVQPTEGSRIADPLPVVQPTTQKKLSKETIQNMPVAFSMLPPVFEQEKKKKNTKKEKTKEILTIPEIQSLLEILAANGTKLSTVSSNLKMLMLHAVEAHGVEFCEAAIRGRVIQAARDSKPLWLSTLFDPEKGEWLSDCARLGESESKKVLDMKHRFEIPEREMSAEEIKGLHDSVKSLAAR